MRTFLLATALMAATAANAQNYIAELAPPWDGIVVPAGQQCRLFGGKGATPQINLQGLPESAAQMRVEFNDKSYEPLAENGSHGVIGFQVSGPDTVLPSVPSMTSNLLPCSGGRGNRYMADILALDSRGQEVARQAVELGRY